MHLRAIHTIHRAPDGKQMVLAPGSEFECPDDEGQDYLALRAASVIEAPELPLEIAPVPEAKPAPAAKKAAAAKKAEAAPAPAPAAPPATPPAPEETVAGGENSDDMLD